MTAAERRVEALRLRREGQSFREIGCRLGVSRQAAHKLTMQALDALASEQREEASRLQALESSRLDALIAVQWPRAMEGDHAAWDRVLRAVNARCRLFGLAPAEPLVSIAVDARPESPALRQARESLPPLEEVIGPSSEWLPGTDRRAVAALPARGGP